MVRKRATGLIKEALRKFEQLALKNEIDDTGVWFCYQFVSRTKVWLYFEDRANFSPPGIQIFRLFYAAFIFFSLHQGKKKIGTDPIGKVFANNLPNPE